jgi:hypothetical protein
MAVRVSVDTDTWWHLRAGEWMAENRQIITTDVFSFTRNGQPWHDVSWLSELALYGAFRSLGFAGLNLFTALLVTLAFAFVWRAMEGPPLLRAFVLILAAAASAVYWSARPQIVSFALAGLFLLLLERARQGKRGGLWALPPLMALWANVHGGFAVGFILIGAYLAGILLDAAAAVLARAARIREAWLTSRALILGLGGSGLASLAAVCVNPFGVSILRIPFQTISIGVLQQYIQEWQSPDFHELNVQPFVWLLLLVLLALSLSRRSKSAVELVSIGGLAYLSLIAARNIALFALVAAPILARHLDAALEPLRTAWDRGPAVPERVARSINLAAFLLLAVAALVKVIDPLSPARNQEAIRHMEPVAAVDFVRSARPAGRLLNSYNWGGYILWALYPDYPTFVDGRTDLFDQPLLQAYISAWRADPGWEGLVERWDIRLAMLETDSPLARAMRAEGWHTLYQDGQAVVLARE